MQVHACLCVEAKYNFQELVLSFHLVETGPLLFLAFCALRLWLAWELLGNSLVSPSHLGVGVLELQMGLIKLSYSGSGDYPTGHALTSFQPSLPVYSLSLGKGTIDVLFRAEHSTLAYF